MPKASPQRRVAIRYGRIRGKKRKHVTSEHFSIFKVYVPKRLLGKLEDVSTRTKIPVSRLFCYAVFNELELGPDMFRFDSTVPIHTSSEFGEESLKVYRWLEFHQGGMSMDTLILCKDDIGISDKNVLVKSVRLLLDKGLAELIDSPKTKGVKHLQLVTQADKRGPVPAPVPETPAVASTKPKYRLRD